MARLPTRMQRWLGCGGCVIVLAGFAALLLSVGGIVGPIVVAIAAVVVTLLVAQTLIAKRRAIAAFRAAYAGSGKDVVVVYTDSPHWKEYIETRWLPRWGDRAIAFDRSKPWRVDQPEARLWRAVAGAVEHTPVVIVVPPSGRVQIVRFFLAFRDHKHGREQRLREAEARLAQLLGETSE
ncbi:MAG: hypothetical protein ACJ79A_17455 [Gemmatimonadaceae bacterium]